MEVGKFYEVTYFTIQVISERELIYFSDDNITRCSHAPFVDDELSEITKQEYKERLDKLMVRLHLVDDTEF